MMKELLLKAPDYQLDESMKEKIKAWSNPIKAIEILEVLDHCIHASLASGFIIKTLQLLYDIALRDEGTTHEEVVKSATWREELV